jgi:PAS domain S-box-containing protein
MREADRASGGPERSAPAREAQQSAATRAQLRAVIENIDEGVVIVDADGVVLTINQAARDMIGYEGTSPGPMHADEFREWLDMTTLDGRELPPEERPIARVMAGESYSDYEVRCRQLRTGREWIGSFVGTAVLDASGRVELGVLSGRDVTQRFRAEQQKDVFLATLGHELRNPLASLLAAAQMLLRELPSDARGARWAGIVTRQAEHLSRIVDDLLDVSRMASGRIELQCEPLDMGKLVNEVIEGLRPLFASHQVALSSDLAAEDIWIDGDRTRLAQILDNLLTNAVKFTPTGGSVSVSLRSAEDRAVLTVRDTGIGMDAEVLERLFEPFSQGDQDLGRSAGGLGLGMTLVKGLTELHQGTVTASSPGPGLGSEFVVALPTVVAPLERMPSERTSPGARLRVLVIEDNVDVAEMLAEALRELGQEVKVAGTAMAGIERAREWPPDLVLCDIGLPGALNGYAVARVLAAQEEPPRLVAVTGYGGEEDRRRSREAGFSLHLTKPVSIDQLVALLEPVRRT